MRALILILALLVGAPASAAEIGGAGWRLETGSRLRPAGVVNGWILLRDAEAPAAAEDYGLMMLRAQRPVPQAERPGRLQAMLRTLRPFRFGALPATAALRVAGLPGEALEVSARRALTGVPLVVRAMLVHAPGRSILMVASAPEGEWAGLRDAMVEMMGSFRPVAGGG